MAALPPVYIQPKSYKHPAGGYFEFHTHRSNNDNATVRNCTVAEWKQIKESIALLGTRFFLN